MKKNGLKCACGKIAQYKKHMKFNGYDIDGWECKSCGEIYYNPEKAEKILLINKLKKIAVKTKLGKIKSNLIWYVPKDFQIALNLQKGENVMAKIEKDNTIKIKPV